MNETRSLDEQYLEFRDKTAPIFAEFPQIEPLRYFIFRDMLVQRKSYTWLNISKYWSRSLLRRPHTVGTIYPAKVIVWIEHHRDVVMGTLIPVYKELIKRKIKTQIISYRPNKALPTSTLYFKYPTSPFPPSWKEDVWNALVNSEPLLQNSSFAQAFTYACADLQGRFDELDKLLDVIRPEIIVDASTGLKGGAALIIAARHKQILSLELQHGITQVFHTPLIADYTLIWGQSTKDTLVELDVPADRLILLGSPRHDAMTPLLGNRARNSFLNALSLTERPTFVFFSNGNDLYRNGNAPIECALWLENVAAEYKDKINFVVRLHPNEDGALYLNCPHLHIIKKTPDLTTTLEGCDWIGSLCSTVLYEALLYHKPVWHFDADHWPDLASNWKRGLAVRIDSLSKLKLMVKDLLERGCPPFDEKKKDQVFANHGRATQTIVDFIQTHLN